MHRVGFGHRPITLLDGRDWLVGSPHISNRHRGAGCIQFGCLVAKPRRRPG